MTTPLTPLRRAYRFHVAHGGYCTPPGRAKCAIDAARAELEATARGWVVEWMPDSDCDRGPIDWGWAKDSPEVKAWEKTKHHCEVALLWSDANEKGDRELLASLSGIWDCDSIYRRIVESELALEALSRLKE